MTRSKKKETPNARNGLPNAERFEQTNTCAMVFNLITHV